MRRIGVAEAKAKLSELLGQVAHRGDKIILLRRGKAVAALVPVEWLDRGGGETRNDWLDSIVGLCSDSADLCDVLDQIVADRQTQMPRETKFPWDG